MHDSGAARWMPLSGALFVLLWVIAFLILGDTVESRDSDATILAYFGNEGQRTREFLALIFLVTASLPFIVFLSVLRSRLDGGAREVWAMAAYGAGLVSTTLWTVAAVLYSLPSLTTNSGGEFELDPDMFRLLSDAGFLVWVSAGTVMSVVVLATSIVGTSEGVIPRWLSRLGYVVAVALLASFLVIPVMLLLAWLLAVSITLVRRRDTSGAPDAPTSLP